MIGDNVGSPVNNPPGGCVCDDVVVVEEGAEQLDGSSAPPGTTLSPVVLRWRVGNQQFLPEGQEPSSTDQFGIMSPVLVGKEKRAPLRCPLGMPMLTSMCWRI